MKHIVSFSGGVPSAVALDRVIERYGRDEVTIWFGDTSWEDDDLYRFVDDCMARWGGELVHHRDGRTPPQVWAERQLIPMMGCMPCNYELKIKPCVAFVSRFFLKPVTIHLGMEWSELDRLDGVRSTYLLPGVQVDFPLLWSEPTDYQAIVKGWGGPYPAPLRSRIPSQ